MPSGLQITCANKNQNGVIVRVGGHNWSLSQSEAIQKLLAKQIRLYITIGDEDFIIRVSGEGQDAYLVLGDDAKKLSEVEQLYSC